MSTNGLSAAEQAGRAETALKVALHRALGLELIDDSDLGAGLCFPVADLAVGPSGHLHAAALGAIIETAAYLAVLPTLGEQEHAVTHAISTQYLRPARTGDRVHVVGTLTRRARTVAFVLVSAHVGGSEDPPLIAQSQVTKSIITP